MMITHSNRGGIQSQTNRATIPLLLGCKILNLLSKLSVEVTTNNADFLHIRTKYRKIEVHIQYRCELVVRLCGIADIFDIDNQIPQINLQTVVSVIPSW
jgi:hypothetical protein